MTALVIALCYIFTVTGLMRSGMVPDDLVPGYVLFIILVWGVVGAIFDALRTINSETPLSRTGGENDQTTKETP